MEKRQTHGIVPREQRTFSGAFLGMQWSFSLRPQGEPDGRQFPDYVGTEKIIPPPQSVPLKFDFEQAYLTGAFNKLATCRIRVYSPTNVLLLRATGEYPELNAQNSYSSAEPTIVLCEPLAIGGITNHAEEIATAVWHLLDQPRTFLWFEHWWKPNLREFLSVSFRCTAQGRLVDPEWTPVQSYEVERLIGSVQQLVRLAPSASPDT